MRKVERSGEVCPARRDADGVWRVTEFAAGRAVLRSTDTMQAGLGIEFSRKLPARVRRPVLYQDGPDHREYRRQTARYFTPKRVDEHYRDLMHRIADREVAVLVRDGRANLSDLSFRLAVDVTTAVLGLTESRPGTAARLERFFPDRPGPAGFSSPMGVVRLVQQLSRWFAFYRNDVRPATRARRLARRDDLISHLVDEGCTDGEILGECLTFAAAGMVTTREFVNVAAWHLLTDEALRARYRAAPEPDRIAVLHEILRLEPAIAALRRRTTEELPLPDGTTIPAGELVDVSVSAGNVDPAMTGDDPVSICPGRAVPAGSSPSGLSFGDGPHRCPGAHVAIQESEIFLTKLLAIDGLRMLTEPTVSFMDHLSAYVVRGLVVAV
jgi:cytochrome P450